MSVSNDYLNYVLEQLAPLAKVATRRMFGAIGLYAEDLFFGLIDDDVLYLKVDDGNRGDYQARNCKAFQPFADTVSMNYFQVPAEVLEDPEELKLWARKSLSAALNSKKPAPKKKTKAGKRRK